MGNSSDHSLLWHNQVHDGLHIPALSTIYLYRKSTSFLFTNYWVPVSIIHLRGSRHMILKLTFHIVLKFGTLRGFFARTFLISNASNGSDKIRDVPLTDPLNRSRDELRSSLPWWSTGLRKSAIQYAFSARYVPYTCLTSWICFLKGT